MGAGDGGDPGVRGVCLEPSYQRIVIHEAPVVMGWERWREAEEHFSYGLVRATVEALVDAGEIEPLPVEVTARILFGALSAGAETIASSPWSRRRPRPRCGRRSSRSSRACAATPTADP